MTTGLDVFDAAIHEGMPLVHFAEGAFIPWAILRNPQEERCAPALAGWTVNTHSKG